MKKLVLMAAVTVFMASAPVGAQSREGRMSPTLALARICVSEAGWACWETGDGLGIHEVILRGADRHDMSYAGFARSYSSAAGASALIYLSVCVGSVNSMNGAMLPRAGLRSATSDEGML